MAETQSIRAALISVYHKTGIEPLVEALTAAGSAIYSTGGTADHLRKLGVEVHEVADLTGYPSILGGRVKTLHPKVHGGILARRDVAEDRAELERYEIPSIDLVVVDLYPFEETLRSGAPESEIIEKIDIGGIALIRAAAKNFRDVAVVASSDYYAPVASWLNDQDGGLTLAQRRELAGAAFDVSSHYDTHIHRYLAPANNHLKVSYGSPQTLRYGENPHQQGYFYGDLNEIFDQLHGKALSYNNLVDIEATLDLVDEFSDQPFFAIIKHTNPCGCATGETLLEAYQKALAGDPVSAFGGILAANGTIEADVAEEIAKLFCEVLVADAFTDEALEILTQKKNIRLLRRISKKAEPRRVRALLNGYLVQEKDEHNVTAGELAVQTSRQPTEAEIRDVLFGDKVVKHLKSNAIALVKDGQLIGSGVGQTSRIDALRQAIEKSKRFGFDLTGAVLASDAFFPFKDSVEAAHMASIEVVVEPGGSRRDSESIEFCEAHNMCLLFTGVRHFKH